MPSWNSIPTGLPRFQKHIIAGHSGAEPYGIYHPYSWASRVSQAVGAEEVNIAISGSIIARPDYASQVGGYSSMINLIRPYLPTVTSGARTIRKVPPYVPPADLISFQTISNDIGGVSTTATRSAAMASDTLLAVVAARARAGAVWGANDVASGSGVGFTFPAAWAVNASGVQLATDGVARQSTTVGSTFDFQTPADHQGEFVYLFGVGWAFGGQYEFRDMTDGGAGVVLGTLDCNTAGGVGGPAASNIRMTAKRLTIPLGARKLRVTLTGLSGSNDGTAVTTGIFDSISLTALDNLPLVVLGNHPRGPGGNQTNTDLINSAVQSVCDAFTDGRVVKADMAGTCATVTVNGTVLNDIAAGSRGSIFRPVDGHANELGHALQTKVWLSTIVAATAKDRKFGDNIGTATPTYRVVQPYNTIMAEACFNNGWSTGGIAALSSQGFSYSKTADNVVRLRGSVKKATTPTALEQILQRGLPAAYRPIEPQAFTVPVLTSAGALKGQATIIIGTDGLIMLLVTGSAAANDLVMLDSIAFGADGGLV